MVDSPSPAAPLRLLAAGAVKAVVLQVAEIFRTRTGGSLDPAFDTVGALRDRVLAGETADVTILSTPALAALAAQGHGRGAPLVLGETGVALGGRRGQPIASIETAEAFRDVLLHAESIGYADPDRGATAGKHFQTVIERMGLQESLRDRLRMFSFGVDAIAALGRGEIAVAVSQATEILTQPDVTYLGLFPAPYQLTTGYGALALSDREGARALLEVLGSAEVAPILRRAGFF